MAQFKKNVRILEKRVDKGIAFLDKNQGRGIWLPKINLKVLDLSDSKICICGQVFGDFWDAISSEILKDFSQANQSGFWLSQAEIEKGLTYDLLTSVWHMKITELKLTA